MNWICQKGKDSLLNIHLDSENGFEHMGTRKTFCISQVSMVWDHMTEKIQESDCVIMVATTRYIQTDVHNENRIKKGISENVHSEVILATIYKKPLLVEN